METDECIIFPFDHKNTSHAPKVMWNGKEISIPAAICTEAYGPKPEGKEPAHSCHVHCCANKKHLSWKTHAENMADSHGNPGFVQGGENHFKSWRW